MFDLFWSEVNKRASDLDVNEPQLSRSSRVHYSLDGLSGGDFPDDLKSLCLCQVYEQIDLIVTFIEDRFNQPGYRVCR